MLNHLFFVFRENQMLFCLENEKCRFGQENNLALSLVIQIIFVGKIVGCQIPEKKLLILNKIFIASKFYERFQVKYAMQTQRMQTLTAFQILSEKLKSISMKFHL